MPLEGVLSAIVTPFTPDGEAIDEQALRRLIDRNLADGIHGFVPAGGTGEFASLTNSERRRLVEIVAEQVDGKASVLAHTGATTTREAVALSKHAEQVGADAVMLATPYYDPVGEEEALAYYAAVADAIDLPICAYNYPPATGFRMSVDFLLRLVREVPQVTMVKDSGADLAQLVALRTEHADAITVLNGEDVLMLPALMLGTPGMVMGVGSFLGPALVRMHEAALAGELERAVALWRQVCPVIAMLSRATYVSGVKAACEILGLPVGRPRAPTRPYSAGQVRDLKSLLDALDPSLLTGA